MKRRVLARFMARLRLRVHRRWLELAETFTDGELGDDERERCLEHLVGCVLCQEHVTITMHLNELIRQSRRGAA